MTNFRLFAVIAASVVLTVLVMGAITRPARADTPRTAECSANTGKDMNALATVQAGWMTAQMAAGRTQFMSLSQSMICAW